MGTRTRAATEFGRKLPRNRVDNCKLLVLNKNHRFHNREGRMPFRIFFRGILLDIRRCQVQYKHLRSYIPLYILQLSNHHHHNRGYRYMCLELNNVHAHSFACIRIHHKRFHSTLPRTHRNPPPRTSRAPRTRDCTMRSGSRCASRSGTASASGPPRLRSESGMRTAIRLLTETDVDPVIGFRPLQLESGADLAMTRHRLDLATDAVLATSRPRSESVPGSATGHRYQQPDPGSGVVPANCLLLRPGPVPGAVLPILPCRSVPGSGADLANFPLRLGPVLVIDLDLGFGSGTVPAS